MNTSVLTLEETIADNLKEIDYLKFQNNQLIAKAKAAKTAKGIDQWNGYNFESSSSLTPEFAAFAKDFKKYIKDNLPDGAELVNFNRGHFYLSGFIKRGDKFVYFSCDDVRWSICGGWYDNLLIRTAKHDKDYTGGSNCGTSIKDFKQNTEKLLNQ